MKTKNTQIILVLIVLIVIFLFIRNSNLFSIEDIFNKTITEKYVNFRTTDLTYTNIRSAIAYKAGCDNSIPLTAYGFSTITASFTGTCDSRAEIVNQLLTIPGISATLWTSTRTDELIVCLDRGSSRRLAKYRNTDADASAVSPAPLLGDENSNYTIICREVCLPNCVGKECGEDNCGGSCGTVPSGYFCLNYRLMPLLESGIYCPPNTVYNSTLNLCIYTPNILPQCPSGTIYNSVLNLCTYSPLVGISCPVGTNYNETLSLCISTPIVSIQCPQDTTYDNNLKACISVPETAITCPQNSTYNIITDKCEYTPISAYVCNSGFTYNSSSNKCEQYPAISQPSECLFTIGDFCIKTWMLLILIALLIIVIIVKK